jgi:opacity protein-like surface antigen
MKKLLLIISLFVLPLKANAFLPVGGYVGVRGGANATKEDNNIISGNDIIASNSKLNKDISFISANAGVRLLGFRFEVEFGYRFNTTVENVVAQNVLGNVYYNFFGLPLVKFYVNGGGGFTKFSGSNLILTDTDSFTWNAGLGVNISLLNMFNVDVGYRYINMGELKTKGGQNIKQASNDIYVGVRFGF